MQARGGQGIIAGAASGPWSAYVLGITALIVISVVATTLGDLLVTLADSSAQGDERGGRRG